MAGYSWLSPVRRVSSANGGCAVNWARLSVGYTFITLYPILLDNNAQDADGFECRLSVSPSRVSESRR